MIKGVLSNRLSSTDFLTGKNSPLDYIQVSVETFLGSLERETLSTLNIFLKDLLLLSFFFNSNLFLSSHMISSHHLKKDFISKKPAEKPKR
jgi:hypothetical protein